MVTPAPSRQTPRAWAALCKRDFSPPYCVSIIAVDEVELVAPKMSGLTGKPPLRPVRNGTAACDKTTEPGANDHACWLRITHANATHRVRESP